MNNADEQEFEEQRRNLLVSSSLPPVLVGGNDNDDVRGVDFVSWSLMVKTKYPAVFKMVTAIFSIFHGLHVEFTFNVMRGVIDKHSGHMSIETCSSFQDINFALSSTLGWEQICLVIQEGWSIVYTNQPNLSK